MKHARHRADQNQIFIVGIIVIVLVLVIYLVSSNPVTTGQPVGTSLPPNQNFQPPLTGASSPPPISTANFFASAINRSLAAPSNYIDPSGGQGGVIEYSIVELHNEINPGGIVTYDTLPLLNGGNVF